MNALRLVLVVTFAGALGANAFVLNFNSAGKPNHWGLLVPDPSISTNVINPNTQAIRYFLASDAYSPANATAELNLVRAAFAQWHDGVLRFAHCFCPAAHRVANGETIVAIANQAERDNSTGRGSACGRRIAGIAGLADAGCKCFGEYRSTQESAAL